MLDKSARFKVLCVNGFETNDAQGGAKMSCKCTIIEAGETECFCRGGWTG